ncbi:MAG: flagellar basal-body rod protein FlgG [Myxococcota bacterium]|jgi:flagellar basal-body rod protein FlgG
MIRALNTAATGMEAQQTQIDIIANNLANANTVGFKKSRGEFQDLFYQQLRAASGGDGGTSAPAGLEVGQGVKVAASQKMFTGGDMMQTNNHWDMAIEGGGFFEVRLPDGQAAFTRVGSFKIRDGQVVTSNGYSLEPPIEVPDGYTQVEVSREGTVKVKLPDNDDLVQVGQLQLAMVQNPAGLTSLGRGLFLANGASGSAVKGLPGSDGLGAIEHGFLESSNVKVVEEMIDLISAQRAYEMNSKVIQAADQMLRDAANIR